MLSLEHREIDFFIKETKNYYGELRFLSLRELSYQGRIYNNAEDMIRAWASNLHITFAQEIYELMNQELDVFVTWNKTLLFSDATESSSSSTPQRALEEDFNRLELDASNESSSSKIQRKIS